MFGTLSKAANPIEAHAGKYTAPARRHGGQFPMVLGLRFLIDDGLGEVGQRSAFACPAARIGDEPRGGA